MFYKQIFALLTILLVTYSFVGRLFCKEKKTNYYVLKLSSIGIINPEKTKEARRVNDLIIYKNRLYIGSGDAVKNTGATDVLYYDFKTRGFINEFSVDEEAIYRYKIIGNRLIIPGSDATEDWTLGNIYILTDNGWVKKRAVPNAVHINDIVSFLGKWYIATGDYFTLGDANVSFGGVFCSEDEGNNWELVYSSPSDNRTVSRISSLVVYKNKLYVFPYGFITIKKDEVPKKYQQFLRKPFKDNKYLVLKNDLFGQSEGVIYDGKSWSYLDIVKQPNICYISPFVFKNKLIMSVIAGKFVDYLSLADRAGKNVSSSLFVYDGNKTVKLSVKYTLLRDVVIKKNCLFLLLEKNGEFYIAETSDLKKWKFYAIPPSVSTPLSIEFYGSSFYIGTKDGNIFKSVGIMKKQALDETEPVRFFGVARLPKEGLWYWGAITGWKKEGELGKIECAIRKNNQITVRTDNVSSFNIFIPFSEVEKEKPITLIIDGKIAFRDTIGNHKEFVCTLDEKNLWYVNKGMDDKKTFHYKPIFIGMCSETLSHTDEHFPVASFVADVIRQAVSADVAIIPSSIIKDDLIKGRISLEKLFSLVSPDTIWTFNVNGAELYKMVNFNIKQVNNKRCSISGFSFTYKRGAKCEDNNVVKTSLDPAKNYTVATTHELIKKMKEYLGGETNSKRGYISVINSLIDWFKKNKKISTIKQRINSI